MECTKSSALKGWAWKPGSRAQSRLLPPEVPRALPSPWGCLLNASAWRGGKRGGVLSYKVWGGAPKEFTENHIQLQPMGIGTHASDRKEHLSPTI